MAIAFSEDDGNDLFLDTAGNITLARDKEAVLFACKAAAETLFGEMIYQTNQGLPFFTTIWNGSPNIPQFEAALVTTLLAVEEVKEVEDISTEIIDGVLSYTAIIATSFGTGDITNVI